jgi:hypothetical protein
MNMGELGRIAVGGPHVFTGTGWDPAPLILALAIVAVVRQAGRPVLGPVLIVAILGGLLLDALTDALQVPFAVSLGVWAAALIAVSFRRTQPR